MEYKSEMEQRMESREALRDQRGQGPVLRLVYYSNALFGGLCFHAPLELVNARTFWVKNNWLLAGTWNFDIGQNHFWFWGRERSWEKSQEKKTSIKAYQIVFHNA